MRLPRPLAGFGELARTPLRPLARLMRWTLPKVNGTERLAGLAAPVEILRDRWGVPHIFARSVADAMFAQGYVHAQDRFWQMELNRRVGHGRLSELFGAIAFDTDRLLRTVLGDAITRSMALLDEESTALLDAYARGVNAWLERPGRRLPLELTLLRHEPEPWRPVDTVAWAQMMAWGLSTNWDAELVNAALVARLGPERAARLKGEYAPTNPMVLHEQEHAALYEHALSEFRAAEAWLPMAGLAGMSNNWVVDGTRTSTGKPLLANDPHLSLQMPSIWYEVHLSAPDVEVTGVSLPGAPGVVIGHNRELAWGFTAALPDTEDLYLERFDTTDPHRYQHRGEWLPATVRHEAIRVKGEPTPRRAEIVSTVHGPLVTKLSPLAARKHPYALALKWSAHDGNRIVAAMIGMNRARDWNEFTKALALFDAPSMNVVYADRQGHIGYHVCGAIPIRQERHQGRLPVPGWAGEHEWRGLIPRDELPHGLDPPQHYFVSANNRIAGAGYRHFLGAETMNGNRARRITELLNARDKLSQEDFRRMQLDLECAAARPFCRLLVDERDKILAQPTVQPIRAQVAEALSLLASWDHFLLPSSVPGSLYELTLLFAQRRLLEPHLGTQLTEATMGVGFHPVLNPVVSGFIDRTQLTVMEIFVRDEQEWFRGRTRESLLADALSDAIVWLEHELGKDMREWSWGRVHACGFHHPLGAQKPLDQIFNRGPFPYGGDTNTVWQAAFVPRLPISSEGGFTASWRQIVDLADWDASIVMHTTGQSGHPASPHYDDFIAKWLAGEYHPMLWSRAKIEANLEAKLTLEPI